FAIIVIVEPDCTGGPTRGSDPCLVGHVSEGAIAIVPVKNAAAVLRNIEIGKPIKVVIGHSNAHSVASAWHASLLRYVGKRAIAIVTIQRVAKRGLWVEEIAAAAIDQIDVHPAVIVVVEEGAAGSGSLRQVVLSGTAVYVSPCDSCRAGRQLLEQWVSRWLASPIEQRTVPSGGGYESLGEKQRKCA